MRSLRVGLLQSNAAAPKFVSREASVPFLFVRT